MKTTSSPLLKEYRCRCGKLLLKGVLFQCVVEVKCRRCGALMSWGVADATACALIESDADERLTSAWGDIETVLGCSIGDIIGKRLSDVFPMIRDKARGTVTSSHESGRFYEIPNNTLVLRDGHSRRVGSCIVPRVKDGVFVGYRIFNVPADE